MLSFDEFQMKDGMPIYMQILLYVKRGIVAGTIVSGDEMPSRRVLSALLGVNPNTVQKAYRMLEEEGLIESHSGAKSYVMVSPQQVKALKSELLEEEMQSIIETIQQMGITKEEAVELIEKFWK